LEKLRQFGFESRRENMESIKEEREKMETFMDEEREKTETVTTVERERMETVMTVELTRIPSSNEYPRLYRCCYFFSLRLGLNVWLAIESILWLFLFISALYYEIIYVNKIDLWDFIDQTEEWYFYLIFGDRFYLLDQKIRSE
jgi:hypothetical protein